MTAHFMYSMASYYHPLLLSTGTCPPFVRIQFLKACIIFLSCFCSCTSKPYIDEYAAAFWYHIHFMPRLYITFSFHHRFYILFLYLTKQKQNEKKNFPYPSAMHLCTCTSIASSCIQFYPLNWRLPKKVWLAAHRPHAGVKLLVNGFGIWSECLANQTLAHEHLVVLSSAK